MTISTTISRESFTGDGSTTVFTFNYKHSVETEIKCTHVDNSTGVESTLVLNTDYTVTGAGAASGTVTFPANIARTCCIPSGIACAIGGVYSVSANLAGSTVT